MISIRQTHLKFFMRHNNINVWSRPCGTRGWNRTTALQSFLVLPSPYNGDRVKATSACHKVKLVHIQTSMRFILCSLSNIHSHMYLRRYMTYSVFMRRKIDLQMCLRRYMTFSVLVKPIKTNQPSPAVERIFLPSVPIMSAHVQIDAEVIITELRILDLSLLH